MLNLNSVAVFCGGSSGRKAVYMQEAHRLGEILARREIKLIYGAGTTGLMGAVADGAFSENGYVIGATIRELYDIEKPAEIAKKAGIDEKYIENYLVYRKKTVTLPGDFEWLCLANFGEITLIINKIYL